MYGHNSFYNSYEFSDGIDELNNLLVPSEINTSDKDAYNSDKKQEATSKPKAKADSEKFILADCGTVAKAKLSSSNLIDTDYGNHFLDLFYQPLYKELFSAFNTIMAVLVQINPK